VLLRLSFQAACVVTLALLGVSPAGAVDPPVRSQAQGGHALAKPAPTGGGPIARIKRGVQGLRTRRQLRRAFPSAFWVGSDFVVSSEKGLVPRTTGDERAEASGAGFIVDRVTGAQLRPVRLLRRAFVQRMGPSREEAEQAIEDLMFDAFEYIEYRPDRLRLERGDEAGEVWIARFRGKETSGKAVLRLGPDGRWEADSEDSEADDLVDGSYPRRLFWP